MAIFYPTGGGGSGTGSDEVTATAANVEAGKTAVTSDSGDEAIEGTLRNATNDTDVAHSSSDATPVVTGDAVLIGTNTDNVTRVEIRFNEERGVLEKGTLIGIPQDNVAEAGSLNAGKLFNGQKAFGLTGTYGSDGDVAADDIREGKVAYNASGRVIGSLKDYGVINETLAAGESYTIDEGVYSSGKVTAKTLASQTSGTAAAADILSGKTAVVSGATVTGTMPGLSDNATITYTSSNTTPVIEGDAAFYGINSDNAYRVNIRYKGDNGYLKANTLFGVTPSIMQSAIGLTAAKIANGNTILGLAGTYKGLGNATAADVLSGKTFSTASLSNATGTIASLAGGTYTAGSSAQTISCSGKYMTSNIVINAASSITNLTAANIKKGVTIAGITGTWEGSYKYLAYTLTPESGTKKFYYSGSTGAYYRYVSFNPQSLGFSKIYGYIAIPDGDNRYMSYAYGGDGYPVVAHNTSGEYMNLFLTTNSYNTNMVWSSTSIVVPVVNSNDHVFYFFGVPLNS